MKKKKGEYLEIDDCLGGDRGRIFYVIQQEIIANNDALDDSGVSISAT